jgi:hypothetical protein
MLVPTPGNEFIALVASSISAAYMAVFVLYDIRAREHGRAIPNRFCDAYSGEQSCRQTKPNHDDSLLNPRADLPESGGWGGEGPDAREGEGEEKGTEGESKARGKRRNGLATLK